MTEKAQEPSAAQELPPKQPPLDSLEAVLGAVDLSLTVQETPVPQLGRSVLQRGLSAEEVRLWQKAVFDEAGEVKDTQMAKGMLVAVSLCNHASERIATMDHAVAIMERLGFAAIDILTLAARKLSGIDEDEVKKLRGNSNTTSSDDSHSDSA